MKGERYEYSRKVREIYNTSMVERIQPVVISRAEGATITDTEGKDYIDCFSGITVIDAGHCNERVADAAEVQVDKLIYCCFYVYYSQRKGT